MQSNLVLSRFIPHTCKKTSEALYLGKPPNVYFDLYLKIPKYCCLVEVCI